MLAYNVSEFQIRQAAEAIDVRVVNLNPAGREYRFVLRLNPSHAWQRTSASTFHNGRKVAAVCWHGHREFFRKLFELAPAARVQTAKTREFPKGQRFYTAATFEDTYEQTDVNIGSQMAPMHFSDACTCENGGY